MQASFYQVNGTTPAAADGVVPNLLEKALQAGFQVQVLCPTEERAARLSESLWTYDAISFLPHGEGEDICSELQPVWVTHEMENVNRATMLLALGGALGAVSSDELALYDRVLDVFDASDMQTKQARQRWKTWKEADAELSYFAQTDTGWTKKA